ncbi:MAG: regulatory iron-sulfur-containing complex subunit RicT [Acidobacteriota bacterium]|nr:regulatory iron-sulfur-containing complex subunit RicT [Acidobacteriota bacterium]
MPDMVLLLSESTGKVIRARGNQEPLESGDYCLVESEYGGDLAIVIDTGSDLVQCPKAAREAVKIIRRASQEDIEKFKWLREKEKQAFEFCLQRIKVHKLPMKLVSVRYFFNEKKGIFYYTADGRIDFRQLVKDLAKELKMRIEMRQIGVRDEARLIGGLGVCGRSLCCFSFMKNFEPITIQKARQQQIVINPMKISGLCGRLMCCLAFEEETKGRLYIEEVDNSLVED